MTKRRVSCVTRLSSLSTRMKAGSLLHSSLPTLLPGSPLPSFVGVGDPVSDPGDNIVIKSSIKTSSTPPLEFAAGPSFCFFDFVDFSTSASNLPMWFLTLSISGPNSWTLFMTRAKTFNILGFPPELDIASSRSSFSAFQVASRNVVRPSFEVSTSSIIRVTSSPINDTVPHSVGASNLESISTDGPNADMRFWTAPETSSTLVSFWTKRPCARTAISSMPLPISMTLDSRRETILVSATLPSVPPVISASNSSSSPSSGSDL